MKRVFLYILALTITAMFLIPLLWTVSTALKTRQQVFGTPPRWIPIGYRALDEHGNLQPVTLVSRIDTAAAEVRLQSGPQAGQTIAVELNVIHNKDGQFYAQLRAIEPV